MGLFITFEGPEGSGKTTQTVLLSEALVRQGHTPVCTREPGGTRIGEQIRTVLHDPANRELVSEAEILLYSADRAQHVAQVIRPALERGKVVISDRFAESTFAYQGYGRGLDLTTLTNITNVATGGLRPDLVIYLDIDINIGLGRRRKDHAEGKGEWNRMDDQSLAFYRRVRDGYLAMASQDPARWLVIDGVLPVQDIHRDIMARVQSLLTS
ncbi:MAG: dTMP kinase [Chloroflexi bacterium]|nr:dTMP kinase [Chloroflexota bacterium]